MKINTKLLVESVIVSLFVLIIGMGWEILQGYLQTINYVPDIINSYESVDYLQSKVSLGVIYRFDLRNSIFVSLIFLVFVTLYYVARIYIAKLLKKLDLM